jgi:hypothetical protein
LKKFKPGIHLTLNPMTPNARLSMPVLLCTIALTLIGGILVPAVNAQPNPPAPETTSDPAQPTPPPPEAMPELPKNRGYLGIGGAVGLGGSSTALSTGGLTILSKMPISDSISLHNTAVIFGSSVPSVSVALTYKLPIGNEFQQMMFSPFLGAGVMTHNENGLWASPLVTGGVDLGLSENMTGTIRMNVGFVNGREADVGLIFGIGFNR